jgi:Fe2+ transport system protein FeoA
MEHATETLQTCPAGVPYRVVQLNGGEQFRLRLKNLGITEGKLLTKLHSHPFRGPVTVQVQNAQVALGHGMAGQIVVEPA